VHFRGALSPLAVGADSIGIGLNAVTTPTAPQSAALGPNSRADHFGEVGFGGYVGGVGRQMITQSARTTNADMTFCTMNGNTSDATPGNTVSRLLEGVYDLEVTVLAREIGTDNYARFCRRAVVVVVNFGGMAMLQNQTTPTPDIVPSALTGVSILLGGVSGVATYVAVNGLASKTIQWAAFLDYKRLSITT